MKSVPLNGIAEFNFGELWHDLSVLTELTSAPQQRAGLYCSRQEDTKLIQLFSVFPSLSCTQAHISIRTWRCWHLLFLDHWHISWYRAWGRDTTAGAVLHRRRRKPLNGDRNMLSINQLILTLLCIKVFFPPWRSNLQKHRFTVSWIMSRPFEPDPSVNFIPQRRVNRSGLYYNYTSFKTPGAFGVWKIQV